MWKKDEGQEPEGQPARPVSVPTRVESAGPSRPGGDRATIGKSITIRGDVTGDEDLVIQGRVEGTVDLKQHSVTIGPEGRVKADITGRDVTVEGEVTGNLRAEAHVVLRGSARVEGDLSAPRVMIEDGAVFRGRIDMSESASGGMRGKPGSPAVAVATGTTVTPSVVGGEVKTSAKV